MIDLEPNWGEAISIMRRIMKRTAFLSLGLLTFGLLPSAWSTAQEPQAAEPKPMEAAAADEVAAEAIAFFEDEVLSILQSRCYGCHSHQSGQAKGGLVLDSKAGWERGGSSGPAVLPNDSTNSLLMQAILRDDSVSPMPPDDPMPESEVAILRRWIEMGAVDPRIPVAALPSLDQLWEKAKEHWAFQTLRGTRPLDGSQELDQEIDQRLAAEGLQRAPRATPEQLIRRASFDLIGLPPSVEEIEQFVAQWQNSPDAAMETLVDRLLASPHYGERWARHWMDVARYSDVSGGLRNQGRDDRLPFAFAYRDYLIRAFNNDKPYDRFIQEQIAADLMTLEDPRDLAATTFVAIGSTQGTEEERLAERIDTVMQTFQGLTVGCARCHDHKFDPIPTEDYYALRGVMVSSEELGTSARAERVDNDLCPIIEEPSSPEQRAAWQQQVAEAEKALQDYEEKLWSPQEAKWRSQVGKYLDVMAMTNEERGGLAARDYVRRRLDLSVFNDWDQLIRRATRKHDPLWQPWVVLARLSSDAFAKRAPIEIADLKDHPKGINQLVIEALEAEPPQTMRDVAKVYADLFARIDAQWQERLAEAASGSQPPQPFQNPDKESLRSVLYDPGMPPVRADRKLRDAFGNNGDKKRNELAAKVRQLKYHDPMAPVRAMGLREAGKIQDSPVFVRGEPQQAGDPVPRRYVSVLAGKDPPPFTDGSGRKQWAEAIVHPDNPLTARVLVNRLWLHHFGKGLVQASGDFGLQTPEPIHRTLLDRLSATLQAEGWSIKKLHRIILLSQTWQQSSVEHPQYALAQEKDPENRWLWRQQTQRLEFEPLRDRILSASGRLDRTVFGRSEPLLSQADSTRRTLYATIDRTAPPVILSNFDVPNPSLTQGERFVSTISPQALFLMNNPFVLTNVRAIAEGMKQADLQDDSQRMEWVFRKVLQRSPTPEEVDALMILLEPTPQEIEADRMKKEIADLEADTLQADPKTKRARKQQAQQRRKMLSQLEAKRKNAARTQPMNGWEQVIHALMMSHEFCYVL
ncbi:MAG: PSD1 and planctomycete cytochrome C domain-containing protein [Pirellulaceae bacterium]